MSAGKGDKLRKGANLKSYWENYDNIFRKKNDMSYNITTAKKGDVFYECEYGMNIRMVALEDVRIVKDDTYAGSSGYELWVDTPKGKIELKQAAQCGAYGLKLYKEPAYYEIKILQGKNII